MDKNDHEEKIETKLQDEKIRRRKPCSHGVYVKGTVEGVPVLFTADTGATRTVISDRIYNKMDRAERPILKKSACLTGPGGIPLKELGKAMFRMTLGSLQLDQELYVAEIEDDALLGVDILQNGENGPADILLSKGLIFLNDKEIPCIQVGLEDKARKVTAANDCTIPGHSEAIIEVYVDRQVQDDILDQTDFLIEPTEHFMNAYPLQMGASLVDLNWAPTSKVRLMNPLPTPVTIRQDAVVGQAEAVHATDSVVKRCEYDESTGDDCAIRRLDQSRGRGDLVGKRNIGEGSTAAVPEHLVELYEKSAKKLDEKEKMELKQLLVEYEDVFSKNDWDLGLTHLTEHSIDTGDAAPIKQRPRRVPLAFAKEEKKAIDDLLAMGVIRKSTSPWASPIILVRKKTGAVRPCVDYRRVNSLVKPDGFPLPRTQDCLDAVAGAQLFSTFDLTSGYFQIPLKEADKPKSAFVCKYGHFEMNRLPFGLNTSGNTFQRTMELALQGLQWETCLIYIDDIIVFGANFEEHSQRVRQVLRRLREAGLKLKPAKCEMLQEEVTFLGHVVSGKGVRPNPVNIAKVADWPRPVNAKQVKQFVAFGSYYRRFVERFAQMARPLTELTKKDKKFDWTESCEDAFVKLKMALISPDVMGYPREEGEFILDTDASDVGIGCVLTQWQDDRERVIAYASRAINKAERNYCITEKELLAVRFFVEYFRQYLLGRHFKVRTDHQALVWLFKLKEPRGKIARWTEILSSYDFEIEYRPGQKHANCDALSRCINPRDCTCMEEDTLEQLKCLPCKKCRKRADDMLLDDRITAMLFGEKEAAGTEHREPAEEPTLDLNPESTMEPTRALDEGPGQPTPGTSKNEEKCGKPDTILTWDWKHATQDLNEKQLKDADVGPILKAKLEGRRPTSQEMVTFSQAARHYWLLWDSLELKDELLFKKFTSRDQTGDFCQFIVPQDMKSKILHQVHDNLLSGHLGCKRSLQKLRQKFYWFSMKQDVAIHIKKCDICEADKQPRKSPRAPLGTLSSGAPWDVVATDYIGPFPVTPRGNRFILVLTDHFSKYVEVLAVPDQTAETCASKILNEFVSRWGCPLSIHSDQGRNYESRVFRELCRMLEVRKTRTSPRNPRGNGQSERFNRTLLKMIKAYLCGEQRDWDLNLGCLAGAYRASPHATTKLTPNLLTLGREVRIPAEVIFSSATSAGGEEITSYGEYVDSLRTKLQKAHHVARQHMGVAAKRSKEVYDAKMVKTNYQDGDYVWCLAEARKVGVAPKLERHYAGPYLIAKKVSEVNFVLQLDREGKERLVHHNKLKLYEGTPKGWLRKARKKILEKRL